MDDDVDAICSRRGSKTTSLRLGRHCYNDRLHDLVYEINAPIGIFNLTSINNVVTEFRSALKKINCRSDAVCEEDLEEEKAGNFGLLGLSFVTS